MAPSMSVKLRHQGTVKLEEPEGKADSTEETVRPGQVAASHTDDGESMISFRTSQRVQEALYRMIQQRVEGSHSSSVSATKKGMHSTAKRHKQLSPERIAVKEEIEDACEDEPDSTPLTEIVQKMRGRRTKRQRFKSSTKIHNSDPVLTHISSDKKKAVMTPASPACHGKQQLPISTSSSPESIAENAGQADEAAIPSPNSSSGEKQQRRQRPLSSVDLFCNHIGPKGWRCYRTRLEGKFFCSYHQSKFKPIVSFAGGNSRAVCT